MNIKENIMMSRKKSAFIVLKILNQICIVKYKKNPKLKIFSRIIKIRFLILHFFLWIGNQVQVIFTIKQKV